MSTILKDGKFDDDVVPYQPEDAVQLDIPFMKSARTREDQIQIQMQQHQKLFDLQRWFRKNYPQLMVRDMSVCQLEKAFQWIAKNNGTWKSAKKTPAEVLETFKESLAKKPKLARTMYNGLMVHQGRKYTKLLHDTILK